MLNNRHAGRVKYRIQYSNSYKEENMIMKRLVVFFVAVLCCVGAAAQNNLVYEPVVLTIDKADGQYALGETVNVYGQLMGDVAAELVCVVEANGKYIQRPVVVKLKKDEKTLVYSSSFDKPTAAQVYVFPKGNDKVKAAVGFVVDAQGFRPGFDDPKDFDKFWSKQLKEVRKCKMTPELTPAEFPDNAKRFEGKCELYALKVNMPEGRPVHAYIAWPKGAEKASLPIVIFLHGAGYSRSNAVNAARWASRGVIAIDINAHGYPDDQPKEYYDNLAKGELKDYRTRMVTDHESFYFRLMYLRAVRAIDFATTLPIWDGKRIMTYGGSQGGAQSIAVAAIDKRVGAVYAYVPAVTDLAGHLQQHRGGWPGYDRQMKKKNNLEAEMAVLPYYDGAIMIQHTNAKLWIEAGLIDTVCPPECVLSAYNVAVSPDKTLYTFPYRPHSDSKIDKRVRDQWLEAIDDPRSKEIRAWLK